MSKSNSSSSGGGVGLLGLLGIVFITLKLCGVISWSWWWVTVPLWGFFGIITIALLIGGLVLVVLKLLGK